MGIITDNRQELYNQGLTDHQIAEQTGKSLAAIKEWRYYNRLPNNKEFNRKERRPRTFRDVLPEEKHGKMMMFLYLVDKCRPGDVGEFMNVFRHNMEG